MNFNFFKVLFGVLLVFSLSSITNAQSATILEDGITIATKLQRANKTDIRLSVLSIAAQKINDKFVEHRILVDKTNKIYFGYDLEIALDTENSRFKVSFKPLSLSEEKIQMYFDRGKRISRIGNDLSKPIKSNNLKTPDSLSDDLNIKTLTANSLPKYPSEIIIGDDDIIALDILENPQTKEKITDLIRVTAKTKNSMSSLFSEPEQPAKDFSLLDVELQMLRYDVFVNNERKAEFKGGAVGSLISFYIKDKGLCVFSLFPREEYSLNSTSRKFIKSGRIEENKLFFKIGNEEYEVVARSPILPQGGNWNLWMMHMPEYTPSQYTSLYKKDFAFYGTDYMNTILSSAEKSKR